MDTEKREAEKEWKWLSGSEAGTSLGEAAEAASREGLCGLLARGPP